MHQTTPTPKRSEVCRLREELAKAKAMNAELVEVLKKMVAAMERYEQDADGDAPIEHVLMMRDARKALNQNPK